MLTRIAYYSSAALVAALTACGGGGGSSSGDGGDDGSTDAAATGVESRDLTYTARPDGTDSDPSVSFYVEEAGKLGVRVNGLDTDGDGTVSKPEVKNVTLEEGDTLTGAATELACESADDSDIGDTFDVGVNLDTTASMGAAAGILATETANFATELESRGLDVRFAGMTMGDAFATKNPESSGFTDSVSTGSLGAPPAFDAAERPGTGSGLRSAAEMETFFQEVSNVVGNGAGGGDGTENYLGAVEYLNDNVGWRDGAGRILISIGDACAHTPTTNTFITEDWAPSEPSALEDKLGDSGVAVNVVGSDFASDTCSSFDAYDVKDLADATGGASTNIGNCGSEDTCDVNLIDLPLIDAVSTARATESCDLGGETGTRTVRMDIEIDGLTWRAAAVLELLE